MTTVILRTRILPPSSSENDSGSDSDGDDGNSDGGSAMDITPPPFPDFNSRGAASTRTANDVAQLGTGPRPQNVIDLTMEN